MPHPWKHSRSGWMGLWATWSGWRRPWSLQGGWTRWHLKVLCNPNSSLILILITLSLIRLYSLWASGTTIFDSQEFTLCKYSLPCLLPNPLSLKSVLYSKKGIKNLLMQKVWSAAGLSLVYLLLCIIFYVCYLTKWHLSGAKDKSQQS